MAVIIGLVGAGLVLVAYFGLTAGKLREDGYVFPLLNMSGSLGVLMSLTAQWNLSSAVINSAWVVISLAGMVRLYRKRKSPSSQPSLTREEGE